MKRNPAFLAAPLLAILAATGACTPTSKVAEPDIVMKSPVAPNVLAPCLAIKLGERTIADLGGLSLRHLQEFLRKLETDTESLSGRLRNQVERA